MNPLRKNQEEALHYFKQHYYENKETRGILSMCCGSGKTRTFYEIMKYCFSQNEKLCIYTTSRILLVENAIQEILEYLYLENTNAKNITKDFCIMVKVSNFNIENIKKNIHIKFNQKYKDKDSLFNEFFSKKIDFVILGLSSNTYDYSESFDYNNIIINEQLRQNKNILIVTTYDSLVKMYIETRPDLIICDESHHLVSDNNKLTNKIIDTKLLNTINPNKYLFMTATPLTIKDIIQNNKSTTIYSMENEYIFGKCFYEYTFYDGIQDKCIVSFDVLGYDKLILKNNNPVSVIEKQTIYFNVVIEQMLKTMIEFNLKRTIVYISNQEKAKKMKTMVENAIKNNSDYNNIGVNWIISEDNHSVKTKRIEWFKDTEVTNDNKISKILISVNIFDEGIDIPICDSVLFAESRHSETQIVQNIGRALRLHPTKQKAYVILPVYFPEHLDENINEKNKLEGFSDIFNICNKLLRQNIRQMYSRKYIGAVSERGENKKEESFNKINNGKEINRNSKIYDENNKEYPSNIESITITKVDIERNENAQNIIFQDNTEDYEKYKKSVQLNKIQNLYDLNLFNKNETKIIIQDILPHNVFKESFISYGDLLYNETNSYDYSILYLKHNPILRNYIDLIINTSCEWEKYQNDLINDLFFNKNIHDETKQQLQLQDFLKLPIFPKKYYSNVWRNWSQYLKKQLKEDDVIPNKKKPASYTSRAHENFNHLHNSSWNLTPIRSESILEFLSYIKTYYNIDNMELKCFVNHNITGECKYIYLYFEKELIFTINNTGKISYTPHNFKNTSFTPTPSQFNKNRSLQIKGIDVINVFNNIHLD